MLMISQGNCRASASAVVFGPQQPAEVGARGDEFVPRVAVEVPLGGVRAHDLNRALAIEKAILGAEPGDLLLIAGKGHEDYQIIGGEKRHFDDREQARRALSDRRARRGSRS